MTQIRIEKVSIIDAGTECIVNAANEHLQGGLGVCGAIFKAAGWSKLQAACDAIGHCDTGSAVITPAFNIKAKYIIHAVGPVWHDGKQKEPQKLFGCYKASLELMKKQGCHSIAFPLISAGIFGYPKDKAWRKALQACNDFIKKNPDYDADILFAVLDDHILNLGMEEQYRQKTEMDEIRKAKAERLLEKLNGKDLKAAIEAVRLADGGKLVGGVQEDGSYEPIGHEYPDGISKSFALFDLDQNYRNHYTRYCEGVLPSEMNVLQIRTLLTYMIRGEHFCDGFISQFLRDKTLLKLLLRLDDLLIRYYEKHHLPVEMRFQNPVFWYEKGKDDTPVLVKGNGERLTISQKSDIFDQTVQSQQGWQRAMLFMEYDSVWDATGFGCAMDTTLSYGPDENGKQFTFTTCQAAEKNVYQYLASEQIKTCRRNVDDFYSDPRLQMQWKDVILYPVCVILNPDGSLEPVSLRTLDPGILDLYTCGSINIGHQRT